jgi:hypothetical protein
MAADAKGGLLAGLVAVLAMAMLYFQQPDPTGEPASVRTKPAVIQANGNPGKPPVTAQPVSRIQPNQEASGETEGEFSGEDLDLNRK